MAGRPKTSDGTKKLQLTLAVEVDAALDRLIAAGFYGRSKSEVVTNLLSREFERLAKDDVVGKLRALSTKDRP